MFRAPLPVDVGPITTASAPISPQLSVLDHEVVSPSTKPHVDEISFSGSEAETSVGDSDLTSLSINIHFKPIDVRVASRVIQPTSRATTILVPSKSHDRPGSTSMTSTSGSASRPQHTLPPYGMEGDADNSQVFGKATSQESAVLPIMQSHDVKSGGVEFHASGAGTKPQKTQSSFRAVVHRKVSEPSSTTSSEPKTTPPVFLPETPQPSRVQQATIANPQAPSTPGYGDLEMLLENAALLELRLKEDGDFSGAAPIEPPRGPVPAIQSLSINPTISEPSAQKTAVDVGSSTIGRKIITPGPRSTSLPQAENAVLSTLDVPSKINTAEVTQATVPTIVTPEQLGHLEPSPEVQTTSQDETPPVVPSNPPVPRYFSSFRKKTAGRPATTYETSVHHRQSISTTSEMSYDDCLVTPGDDSYESSLHPSDAMSVKSGRAWSLARKKSGMGIGRAASFAGKLLQRKRTKSGTSTSGKWHCIKLEDAPNASIR
jgi:hypothetical protein